MSHVSLVGVLLYAMKYLRSGISHSVDVVRHMENACENSEMGASVF
jgi:hypothetical protein